MYSNSNNKACDLLQNGKFSYIWPWNLVSPFSVKTKNYLSLIAMNTAVWTTNSPLIFRFLFDTADTHSKKKSGTRDWPPQLTVSIYAVVVRNWWQREKKNNHIFIAMLNKNLYSLSIVDERLWGNVYPFGGVVRDPKNNWGIFFLSL